MRWRVTVAFSVVALAAGPAHASCGYLLQQPKAIDQADVAFEGVALPSADGYVNEPMHFKVVRYLKGTGPAVVVVRGGVGHLPDDSFSMTSVSIDPGVGEMWVVYASEFNGQLGTSVCQGSRLIGAAAKRPPLSGHPETGPWILLGGTAGLAIVIGDGWLIARRIVGMGEQA